MRSDQAQLTGIFEGLANKHRRSIVHALSLGPMTISALAKHEGLSLPAIHKHIVVLEGAGLIRRKKSGRCNFLALQRTGLTALRDWVNQYQVYWGSEHESLTNYIANLKQ